MRGLIPITLFALLIAGCNHSDKKTGPFLVSGGNNSQSRDSTKLTNILWLDSTTKNFGKIAEGLKLDVSYRFRNSGDKPLIIERVQPSCGCTIAEQPNEPVSPGAEGVIRASFNSEGRAGINHKTLFVYANTKGSQSSELHFVVEVEKKKW